MTNRICYFGLTIALTALFPMGPALACEYLTVRDAAFQEPRDIHRLVLLIRSTDKGIHEMESNIREWIEGYGQTLNLEFLTLDVEDTEIDWSEYGIPGPPPSTPATVLVGTNQRTRKNFFIRHWDPTPKMDELDAIVQSQFRDQIDDSLLKEVGVIVHSPGNEGGSEEIAEILAGIEKDWDEKEKAGISLLTLDRANEEEKLVVSFLGIPKKGPDWVCILFGRGKAMDPWIGENINEGELNGQLETLIGECSCLQTAGALGVDLPMVWTDEMDSRMIPLREPIEEEEETALAGIRDSGMFGTPIILVLGFLCGILILGTGLVLVRSRRQSAPLVS